jgi:dGTPase
VARRPRNRTVVTGPNAAARFRAEEAPDSRTHFERDRDRILYAGAFARLAEITQVVSPERGYVFHNRLTHSLKVAQISRRIAEKLIREQPREIAALGGLDPSVAESAGLAHDLGHPPFGHIAEQELDVLTRKAGANDGYEGNAQSFRIVVRLANSDARDRDDQPIEGLNLTRATLNSILKYPWAHGASRAHPDKWGYYDSEQDVFAWARLGSDPRQRSLAAEIMDWADDVTFAIHDLLDFFCAGRIPIDRCKGERSVERARIIEGMFRRKPKWMKNRTLYEDALSTAVEAFPFDADEGYTDSPEHRARLFNFSTGLIGYFVDAIRIGDRTRETDVRRPVRIEDEARYLVEVLKQFIWEYIIENPELAVAQHGQRVAIRTVFYRLLNAAQQRRWYLFPSGYQEAIRGASRKRDKARVVADCVSAMTEKELLHFYRCVEGIS